MTSHLLQKMELQEAFYSKSEEKVYRYLKNHLSSVEKYTITKLANKARTSTSAVLRFCQTLGYKGFKDFKYDVIADLHTDTPAQSEDLIDRMLVDYGKIINQFKLQNKDTFNQLADKLLEGKTIHILGIFLSAIPARLLHLGLQDLGIASHLATDLNSASHLTNIIQERDILIMFSQSGSRYNFNHSISALSQNMPKESYLITLNEHAQTQKFFSRTIFLPGHSITKQSIIDMQSIPLMFIEILINLIHNRM